MIEADVVVVGAGPAGASFALNLARFRRVLVVERRATPGPRIGESLPPAARRLLTDMGLWPSFRAEGHAPCHANRAAWGGPAPTETDFLRDPDGHGWHLDRARFEAWLRRVAEARGAALLTPARLDTVARDGPAWRLTLATNHGAIPVVARLLVDAGGRAAPLARRLGPGPRQDDRLVCGWVYGRSEGGEGLTSIEAEPDGWWYTAPLPAGRRVLAFHTDADLPAAADTRDVARLLARVPGGGLLAETLAAANFAPEVDRSGVAAANSAALAPPCGDGWLAVGDAALAFDPLSSQGLLDALYTGLAAAEAADRHLAGDATALPGYARALERVHAAYVTHLAHWYGQVRRWPDRPFWARRPGPPGSAG